MRDHEPLVWRGRGTRVDGLRFKGAVEVREAKVEPKWQTNYHVQPQLGATNRLGLGVSKGLRAGCGCWSGVVGIGLIWKGAQHAMQKGSRIKKWVQFLHLHVDSWEAPQLQILNLTHQQIPPPTLPRPYSNKTSVVFEGVKLKDHTFKKPEIPSPQQLSNLLPKTPRSCHQRFRVYGVGLSGLRVPLRGCGSGMRTGATTASSSWPPRGFHLVPCEFVLPRSLPDFATSFGTAVGIPNPSSIWKKPLGVKTENRSDASPPAAPAARTSRRCPR